MYHLKLHWILGNGILENQDLVSGKCQFSLKYPCIAFLRMKNNQRTGIPVSFISIRALYAYDSYI